MVSTSITKEKWDALSKDEKDELKKLLLEKKKQSVMSVKELADREDFSEADGINGTSFDSEQKAILKGLGEDVHFVKIVLIIMLIANGIVLFGVWRHVSQLMLLFEGFSRIINMF